ncbi:MAG: hypothetical protein ACYTG7_03070, partial [Planctomycetota bacterium]
MDDPMLVTMNVQYVEEVTFIVAITDCRTREFADWVDARLFTHPTQLLAREYVNVMCNDNGDGLLDPSESADMNLDVENRSIGASLPASASSTATEPNSVYVTVNTPFIDLG